MASKKETNYRDEQAALQATLHEGAFAPVYLVTGAQDYLRTQTRDQIRKALLGDGDAMNYAYYTGKDFTIQEIRDLAETLPFFADRRVIVIENSWLFDKKSGGDTDALTDYLPQMPETTHIVFVDGSVDKTRRLYKAIKKIGHVVDCVTPSPEDLQRWILGRCKSANLTMTREAYQRFLQDIGEEQSMLLMQSELDKLTSYCMGRGTITEEDVAVICSPQVGDRIFDMISAITAHQTNLALEIYMELLQRQTAPQIILALMIRNYNQLLQIGELKAAGTAPEEIASRMHLNPWALRKRLLPSLAGQTAAGLTHALTLCLQADQDYKAGRISDRLAVEQLIITCAA